LSPLGILNDKFEGENKMAEMLAVAPIDQVLRDGPRRFDK